MKTIKAWALVWRDNKEMFYVESHLPEVYSDRLSAKEAIDTILGSNELRKSVKAVPCKIIIN
jgi:hypothetical protein